MSELALPRPRSRRKKIKPPHPAWWFSVAMTLLAILALYRSLLRLPSPDAALNALSDVAYLSLFWPRTRFFDRFTPYSQREWLVARIAIGLTIMAGALQLVGV